jgi:hypothetical protein
MTMATEETQVKPGADNENLLARIEKLELQVAELTRQLDALSGRVANGGKTQVAAEPVKRPALLPDSIGEKLTPAMERVIARMNRGEAKEAFNDLRSIPAEELASQPVSVALVAAALCMQRGETDAGLKAIRKVRTLTDDPRVLSILKRLESQSQAKAG